MGKSQKSFEEYHKAIKLDPQQAHYYHDLGAAYARENMWPQAEQSLHEALKLDPDHEPTKRLLQQIQGRLK